MEPKTNKKTEAEKINEIKQLFEEYARKTKALRESSNDSSCRDWDARGKLVVACMNNGYYGQAAIDLVEALDDVGSIEEVDVEAILKEYIFDEEKEKASVYYVS